MDCFQGCALGISMKTVILEERLFQGQESVHTEATLLPTSWPLFVFKNKTRNNKSHSLTDRRLY